MSPLFPAIKSRLRSIHPDWTRLQMIRWQQEQEATGDEGTGDWSSSSRCKPAVVIPDFQENIYISMVSRAFCRTFGGSAEVSGRTTGWRSPKPLFYLSTCTCLWHFWAGSFAFCFHSCSDFHSSKNVFLLNTGKDVLVWTKRDSIMVQETRKISKSESKGHRSRGCLICVLQRDCGKIGWERNKKQWETPPECDQIKGAQWD